MKSLFITLLITSCFLTKLFAAKEHEILFKSTYSDGFGVYMKRVFTLKKIDPTKEMKRVMKGERHKRIHILVSNKNTKNALLPIDCSDELYAKLLQAIEGKDVLKIVGVGYESIVATGIPGMGMTVEVDDIVLPAGFTWSANNIFILKSFEIYKEAR